MAEYENPEYDKDDYDKEAETSFTDEEEFQRTLNSQFAGLNDLTGDDRKTLFNSIGQKMIDRFYEKNEEPKRKIKGLSLKKDDIGRPMLYVKDGDGNNVALTYYRSNAPDEIATFLSFNTLQRKYGVDFVRNVLGVDDFKPSATRLKEGREALTALLDTQLRETQSDLLSEKFKNLDNDVSSQQEAQELLETANNAETSVKTLETSFIESVSSEAGTQTDWTKREIDGIANAMTTVKEEIANELAKLNETNKDLAKENTKLEQAKADNDEFQIERISSRIKELESERSARLEVINVNKDKLRSQVNRIKETINKVLKEDTTLGERIRTLFREQGITIVSVLTAFGMIIGVIVEAVIPTTGGGTTSTPPSTPKGESGVKDWVKKQLSNLGKLLSTLAGKVATALPGIIGSIVSWLLSSAGKVVNWFGEHLWALVVLVARLLYASAREFIRKKRT